MTWKIRIPTCHDQCMGPHILHKIYTEENKANSLRLEYYSMWLLKDNVLVYMDFRPLYQRFSSTFIFSSFHLVCFILFLVITYTFSLFFYSHIYILFSFHLHIFYFFIKYTFLLPLYFFFLFSRQLYLGLFL